MKLFVVIGLVLVLIGALIGVLAIQAEQAPDEASHAEARRVRAADLDRFGGYEGSPEAASSDALALALRELGQEVSELRRAVEELQGAPLREPVDSGGTSDAAARSGQGRELARLEASMRAEFDALRSLIELGERHALVDAIRSDKRHADWTAWEEVIAAWRRSPEEARKLVKLLTSDELIDRFGPPTDVWANQLGLTWQYEREHPLDPGLTQEIILRLPDGFVAQLAVRELKKETGDE